MYNVVYRCNQNIIQLYAITLCAISIIFFTNAITHKLEIESKKSSQSRESLRICLNKEECDMTLIRRQ